MWETFAVAWWMWDTTDAVAELGSSTALEREWRGGGGEGREQLDKVPTKGGGGKVHSIAVATGAGWNLERL